MCCIQVIRHLPLNLVPNDPKLVHFTRASVSIIEQVPIYILGVDTFVFFLHFLRKTTNGYLNLFMNVFIVNLLCNVLILMALILSLKFIFVFANLKNLFACFRSSNSLAYFLLAKNVECILNSFIIQTNIWRTFDSNTHTYLMERTSRIFSVAFGIVYEKNIFMVQIVQCATFGNSAWKIRTQLQ